MNLDIEKIKATLSKAGGIIANSNLANSSAIYFECLEALAALDAYDPDEFLKKALEWRGISWVDEACDKCGGSGVICYGSTATWHGGIGGQAITNGVCDECWGSGNKFDKWPDLRKLRFAIMSAGKE